MELYELLEHTPEHGALDASKFEELSSLGFSLVRLKPKGKEADREKEWQKLCATFRPVSESGRKADENMGIAVGPASGVVVVDIDNPDRFMQWCVDNNVRGDLNTRIHKSPKGWHIFYQRWEGCEGHNRAIRKDMGCDLMIDKTQVVAPGSVVRKEDGLDYSYVVASDLPPSQPPQWLVRQVGQAPERSVSMDVPTTQDDRQEEPTCVGNGTGAASEYLAKWLDNLSATPPPVGERNDTLFRILAGAQGIGANRTMIMSYAAKLGDLMGIPRFEAMKTGESATKKPANRAKEKAISKTLDPPDGLKLDIADFIDGLVGEYALARSLEDFYEDKFRFCSSSRTWYKNRDNVCESCSQPAVLSPCLDFLAYYMAADDDFKAALKKQYINLQSAKTFSAIISLLKSSDSKLNIEEGAFDRNAMKLPLRNAIIEMKDREPVVNIRPIHWSDYIRKTIDLDWPGEFGEYDATKMASLKDDGFKEFDAMLNRIFHCNPELKPIVVKLLGYAISGTQDKLKKLPIMIGEGNNGKSVLFRALQRSLAPMATTVDKSVVVSRQTDSAPKPELLVLQGARIGFIGETEETDYLNESTVKALTGGDIRTARNLYSAEMIQLQPTYTLILATNHEPRVSGGGVAMWRRLLPIPFNTVFTDSPTHPHEMPITRGVWEWCDTPHIGIVIYLLFGWLRFCEQGLGELPACVTDYLRQYKNEEDPYAEFRDECLYSVPGEKMISRNLVIAYRNWCNDHQISISNRLGDRAIRRGIMSSLKEWGATEKKTMDGMTAFDVAFKPLQDTYAKPRPIRSYYEKSL